MSYPEIEWARECLQKAGLDFDVNCTYGSRSGKQYGRMYDFYVLKYNTIIDFSGQDVIDRKSDRPIDRNANELKAGYRVIIISFSIKPSDKDLLCQYILAALTDTKYRFICLSKPKDKLLYLPDTF